MDLNGAIRQLLRVIGTDRMAKNGMYKVTSLFEPFYDWYVETSPSEQAKARESLDDKDCQILGILSEMMNAEAWRKREPKYLRMSLVALGVENARHEWRYSYGRLAMIWHVAERLGMDVEKTVAESERFAGAELRRHISSFRQGSAEAKKIGVYGFVETQTNKGPGFKYVEPPFLFDN